MCVCVCWKSTDYSTGHPDWMSSCLPYFHTRCGLSANLECSSEMCCTWLHEKNRTQKSPIIRHLRTVAQLCQAVSSQLRHVSTIEKKLIKHQYLPHMSSQYGKLRPISGSHRFTSLGYPSKFQRVSRVGFLTVLMSLNGCQPNFARCLAVSWAGTLCICFWGLLPPNRILQDAKLTLRPSLALSYIDSVIARHSCRGASQTLRR